MKPPRMVGVGPGEKPLAIRLEVEALSIESGACEATQESKGEPQWIVAVCDEEP